MALKPDIFKGWPPGGWQFYQPQTNWEAPSPLQHTFEQQVDNIIAHRKANPRFNLPTERPVVAAELEAYTELRLSKMYTARGMAKFTLQTGASNEAKKKESSFTRISRSVLNGSAGLAGIDTRSLEDWLGAGLKPVDQVLANGRAAVCVTCPANKGGWERAVTVPAAKAIQKYIEHKNRMALATPEDEKLQSCEACHCVLTLKVWQPMSHIRDNTKPETLDKHLAANPDCWVIKEYEQPTGIP